MLMEDETLKQNNNQSEPTHTAETPPALDAQESLKTDTPHAVNKLQTLRTYQGDVEALIGKKKTSVASIVVAEQKRKEVHPEKSFPPVVPPRPSFGTELKNKAFLSFGVEIIVLGLVLVFGIYYFVSLRDTVVVPQHTPIAFSKETEIPLTDKTGEQIIETLLSQKNSTALDKNSIEYVNFTTLARPADVRDVMQRLAPRIPPALIRSLDDAYMIGMYSHTGNEPFIILTNTNYGLSWNAMLEWEKTLIEDVGVLFNVQVENPSEEKTLFTDEALQNKDLRVVRDAERNIVLLYSFLDKNTIVITSTEDVFTGLLGKFVASQKVQ